MDEVCALQAPTRKHVPMGARKFWVECLTRAANACAAHNDELAWVEWFMLAKCVLTAPGDRGGKKHAKSGNQALAASLASWCFKQSGVLRVNGVNHHLKGEKAPPAEGRLDEIHLYFTYTTAAAIGVCNKMPFDCVTSLQ